MPPYRLTDPDGTVEMLEADSIRVEGIHTVLRGTAYVMGRPREIVLRRVLKDVLVEEVEQEVPAAARPSWAVS